MRLASGDFKARVIFKSQVEQGSVARFRVWSRSCESSCVFRTPAEPYEEARISAVQNTPVSTVVEATSESVQLEEWSPVLALAAGFILGTLARVVLALLAEYRLITEILVE